jgi:hypothetical protein
MTSPEQHEQQAADNVGLHELLVAQDRYLDWALTALFYAALHYVDAFLLPEDPRTHSRRNRLVRGRAELAPMWPSYRMLMDRSRDTRYECFDPTPEQLRYYRERHFQPLQDHMRRLLASRSGQ